MKNIGANVRLRRRRKKRGHWVELWPPERWSQGESLKGQSEGLEDVVTREGAGRLSGNQAEPGWLMLQGIYLLR
jgi:hypothetical protein